MNNPPQQPRQPPEESSVTFGPAEQPQPQPSRRVPGNEPVAYGAAAPAQAPPAGTQRRLRWLPAGGSGTGSSGTGSSGAGSMLPWILIAVAALLLLCICGVLTVGPALRAALSPAGTAIAGNPAGTAVAGLGTAAAGAGQPGTPAPGSLGPAGNGVQLGAVALATNLGPQHEALNPTTTFAASNPTIYVVVPAHNIATGDTFFARWIRNGQPYEDSQPLTATQPYPNTYIEFHIQGKAPGGLPPGQYGVQIFDNGNPGPSANFVVQ